jgi:hypothetical protein
MNLCSRNGALGAGATWHYHQLPLLHGVGEGEEVLGETLWQDLLNNPCP